MLIRLYLLSEAFNVSIQIGHQILQHILFLQKLYEFLAHNFNLVAQDFEDLRLLQLKSSML
jgi:hypothetical protein